MTRWPIMRVICAMLAAMMIMCALCVPTRAHDHWISEGGYRNAAGELCCGFALAAGDVKITAAGYLVVSLNETIPYSEALLSPDGQYWRCAWGGTRKCFFAPPPNT